MFTLQAQSPCVPVVSAVCALIYIIRRLCGWRLIEALRSILAWYHCATLQEHSSAKFRFLLLNFLQGRKYFCNRDSSSPDTFHNLGLPASTILNPFLSILGSLILDVSSWLFDVSIDSKRLRCSFPTSLKIMMSPCTHDILYVHWDISSTPSWTVLFHTSQSAPAVSRDTGMTHWNNECSDAESHSVVNYGHQLLRFLDQLCKDTHFPNPMP